MQFAPFTSDIELPFYTSLASLKINHDKLDDSARRLLGLYEVRQTAGPAAGPRMQVSGNALTTDEVPQGYCRAEGIFRNVNTIEDYRNLDKGAVLNRAGRTIWEAILDGTIFSCPSLLSSFTVICFADLKKYKFTYWFAFPALHSDPVWTPDITEGEEKVKRVSKEEAVTLVEEVQTWRYKVDARQYGFFLARRVKTRSHELIIQGVSESGEETTAAVEPDPFSPTTPTQDSQYEWNIASLSEYEQGFFKNVAPQDQYICFADPSTYNENPGWMLRNLLVLIRQRWGLNRVQILSYRDTRERRDEGRSITFKLKAEGDLTLPIAGLNLQNEHSKTRQMPKVTGWERNRDGKLGSRLANLAEYLDPERLADQSVDLNLKLMKWRIAPNLNLDKIKETKCLLLGAGTLGGYVARNLLGWGVRKITFVDNGRVSFSNPVRQPLFNFKDCLEGGQYKAVRAAEALKEIYPGVDATGCVMSVPMAGHPITDESKSRREYSTLRDLIEEHDAVFLLMDTRESRWLPTVMAKESGKIAMNAALGFDTFVVMRHGIKLEDPHKELGCYFCNDVVAPADSVKDQTLDQQCTVTRPGIAAMASAMLVELFVSILQHPDGAAAPAPKSQNEDRGDHPLGILPHQIRGFLTSFQNMAISGPSYNRCSACSTAIVDPYRKDGWGFVKRALNERGYVEELSGLAEIQRSAEKAAADMEWDEEGELGEEEGEGVMV